MRLILESINCISYDQRIEGVAQVHHRLLVILLGLSVPAYEQDTYSTRYLVITLCTICASVKSRYKRTFGGHPKGPLDQKVALLE